MTRRERNRYRDAEMYCSWGKHKVLPVGHVPETFEHGTMCLECQLRIAENVTSAVGIPEMSAALHAHETRKRAEKKAVAATVNRITKGEDVGGFVYYIRINGQIKIGYARDVTARMRHYPPGSELLAVEPGSRYTEAERHQDFRRDLARGREWFTESPSLADHITKLRAELGDPAALAYRFTERKTG